MAGIEACSKLWQASVQQVVVFSGLIVLLVTLANHWRAETLTVA
jgi:hypothetical protein